MSEVNKEERLKHIESSLQHIYGQIMDLKSDFESLLDKKFELQYSKKNFICHVYHSEIDFSGYHHIEGKFIEQSSFPSDDKVWNDFSLDEKEQVISHLEHPDIKDEAKWL